MDPTDHRLVPLRRLAGACAALLLVVTSLSAFLDLTRTGLGCAQWPQCYGQGLHELQQGVAASTPEPAATAALRFVYRALGTVALLLVVAIAIVCLGSRPVLRSEGAIALVLLGLGLFLAVLGRWSSAARVPAVAIGSLLGGVAMLAMCTRLAVAGVPMARMRLRAWVAAAILLMLAQIALGGLVSGSYAALSCNGWAECLEAAQDADWDTLNPWREPQLIGLPPASPQGALVHTLHGGLGIALVGLILPLAVVALRRGRPSSAAALLIFLVAQVAVGLMMSLEGLQLQFAVVHSVLAAALLTTLVLLF
jgi:heme a synthase